MVDIVTLGVNVDTTDLKDGKSDLDQFTAAGVRAEKQTQRLGSTASRAGDAVRRMSGGTGLRMASMQLSQVAQQGAATGSYLQALAIQAPDLALGFGAVGIAAGALVPILYGLGSAYLGAGDDAMSLEDQLDSLSEAMGRFRSAQTDSLQTLSDLRSDFGAYADQAQELLTIQRELANLDATRALSEVATGAANTFGQVTGTFTAYGQEVENFQFTIEELKDEFEITFQEAFNLADALRNVAQADTPEKQVDALRAAREQIELASGGLENMSEEVADVYRSMLDAEKAALALAAVDIASGAGAAADEAARLAENLGISLELAASLASMGPQGMTTVPGRGDPRSMGGGFDDWNYSQADEFLANWKPPRSKAKSGGGGGSRIDPREREAARIFDQTRTAAERYAMEIANLNELRDAGYLSEDAHMRAVKMFGEQLLETGDMGKRMGETISDALADMVVNFDNARDAAAGLLQNLARMFATSAFNSLGIDSFISGLFGSANGNVFSGGRAVTAFANGGVVSGPTMFPMRGSQTGLMGEAGPEAIMPLTRLANGKLGVQASGGGSNVTFAPVIDARGADAAAVARIEAALAKAQAEFQNRVISTVQTAQKRRAL